MRNSYSEYTFTVTPRNPGTEILIAELDQVGFESFMENDTGVLAYIPSEEDHPAILSNINILNSIVFKVDYTVKTIPQKDWNTQWEGQYTPIEIGDTCRIRASFHPKKEVEYDIVINPKMAFGTGHHQTTHLMIQYILETSLENKTMLDMGCGTGVLSILASLKNAKSIDAVDIDRWSFKNTLENVDINNCQQISVYQGSARLLKGKQYDLIFANINRNILLNDMEAYARSLHKNGTLHLSGFYHKDLARIKAKAKTLDLRFKDYKKRDNWVAAAFVHQVV